MKQVFTATALLLLMTTLAVRPMAAQELLEPLIDSSENTLNLTPGSPELDTGLLERAEEEDKPLALELLYTGEAFGNTRGGLRTNKAVAYRGNLDIVITGDLDKLGCLPGGRVFVYGQNGHGPSFSDTYVGDFQYVSNIDAMPFTQISEYWWEKYFLDERLGFVLGKQDANANFAAVELAQDFLNSSFGLHPTIPLPTFPDPAMGAVVLYRLSDKYSIQAGIFDGAAMGEGWGFSGTGETFSMVEFESENDFFGKHGEFHIAAWYHNGEWESLSAYREDPYRGCYGCHVEFEQMLIQLPLDEEEEGSDVHRGLGMFMQYSWSPKNRNPFHEYMGAGLVVRAPFAARMDDSLGIGIARMRIHDPDVAHVAPETAIEFFYKAQLCERMMIQPDIQFIANPGGTLRDAFVVGTRFEVAY